MKHNVALTSEIMSSQSHLDSYTDLTSTWLYLKIFYHWIKNSGSLAPKHSELLVSHHGDLRSEGYLYPYPLWATLDSRVLHSWSYSVRYTHTSHLYTIPVSSYSLVKRTTNSYGIQQLTFDIDIVFVIAYHLITNKF